MIINGYQADLTVSTTAVTLTLPTNKKPGGAVISVIGQPIRFTRDGSTTPTATKGLRAAAGTQIYLHTPEQVAGFKAIREGASDATLAIEYQERLGAIPAVNT